MSNHDELDIRGALQEQAPFDAERAGAVRKEARTQFSNVMRLLTRQLHVTLTLTTMASAFSLSFIMTTNDERQRMLALCYLLIASITGCVAGLAFWVKNTKLSILTDLRETVLAIRGNSDGAWLQGGYATEYTRKRWHFILFILLPLTLLASFGGTGLAHAWAQFDGVLHIDAVISPEGSVAYEAEVGYINLGCHPLFEVPFDSGTPPEQNQFFDLEGHPLTASVTKHDAHFFYSVPLPKPAPHGDWLWYRHKGLREFAAADAGGTRTLDYGAAVSGRKSFYQFSFTLPPNAELIAPQPDQKTTLDDGRLKITYEREKGQTGQTLPFLLKLRFKN